MFEQVLQKKGFTCVFDCGMAWVETHIFQNSISTCPSHESELTELFHNKAVTL